MSEYRIIIKLFPLLSIFHFNFSFHLKLPFQNRSHNQLHRSKHLIMDLPISCQDVYCIYKHALSILIHLKFQDKDGCSKNGYRELLFNLRLENGSNFDKLLRSSYFDSRGIPLNLVNYSLSCDKRDDERIILGFKQLYLNIKSQFPIVQEEREAMTYLLTAFPDLLMDHEISDILDNPILGTHRIFSVCGHVIGIYHPVLFPIRFTSSNHSQLLSSLTQFQHLRSLSFRILGDWDHQEQFMRNWEINWDLN